MCTHAMHIRWKMQVDSAFYSSLRLLSIFVFSCMLVTKSLYLLHRIPQSKILATSMVFAARNGLRGSECVLHITALQLRLDTEYRTFWTALQQTWIARFFANDKLAGNFHYMIYMWRHFWRMNCRYRYLSLLRLANKAWCKFFNGPHQIEILHSSVAPRSTFPAVAQESANS